MLALMLALNLALVLALISVFLFSSENFMRRSLFVPTLLASSLASTTSFAATITVSTTDDEVNADGDCSLREAFDAAANDAAVDACTAGDAGDVIVVGEGFYVVGADLVVDSEGGVVVRGGGATLQLNGSHINVDNSTLRLEHLTLQGASDGAIVALNSDVALDFVVVEGSTGAAPAVKVEFNGLGDRPALRIDHSLFQGLEGSGVVVVAGDTRIANSTFSDVADGAVVINGDGVTDSWSIDHSTFSGNSTSTSGGAVSAAYSGVIESSTFADNSAVVSGGALFFVDAAIVHASLLIGNSSPDGANCKSAAGDATVVSAGGNLVDDVVGCGFDAGDAAAVGATVVGALRDNGGPVPTLLPSGDAIDAGDCVAVDGSVVVRDQRGARVTDGACDVGAVDVGARFLDAILRSSVVGFGDDCAAGGERIDVGVDADGDGVLADDEVGSSVFVCRDDVAPVVVRVDDAAVADCAFGGVVVSSGGDDDRDGVLGDVEVDRRDAICNGAAGDDGADGNDGVDGEDGGQGAPGVPGVDGDRGPAGVDGVDGQNGGAGVSSLIRTAPINAGDDGCNAGGQKIEAGIDDGANGGTAGDGVLDDGEVDSTAVLCNGEAFEDEFAASGGPTCATSTTSSLFPFALLGLLLRRRRR